MISLEDRRQLARDIDTAHAAGCPALPVAKVDIEGHEDRFLAEAPMYLEHCRPFIFSEVNNWFYERRGVSISRELLRVLPEGYGVVLLRYRGGVLGLDPVRLEDLHALRSVENCVLYPEEKLPKLRDVISRS
jgi:hypothetical protein